MDTVKGFIVATQHSWETQPSYSFNHCELVTQGYVTVCPVEVEYTPLDPEVFVQRKIAALTAQQAAIRSAANQEVANIAEEIQKLSCLGYVEPEPVDDVAPMFDRGSWDEVEFTEVNNG